jgi:SAM-dependent methyltransferase
MRVRDAMEMLVGSGVGQLGATTWADLGCGDGTFTRALALLVGPGSVVHAVDVDRARLRAIPASEGEVRIATHAADFTCQPWPFADRLDGILMANSLHYVRDQRAFLERCRARLQPRHRFLFVEYDLDVPNRWVPYPVNRDRLSSLFTDIGYAEVEILRTRPSRYQRAGLYSAMIRS